MPAARAIGLRPPPFTQAINQPYVLDAGDRVRVTVFEQADLTNTYAVDQSGYIAFPLVGAVAARGRTAQQIEADIAAALRKGYLRDPGCVGARWTATARSSSWAKSVQPGNIPMCRA